MLRLLAIVLCAQVAFGGVENGWHSSRPQPIVSVEAPAGSQLPVFSVQAPPQRVQEAIPEPIYSLQTNVRSPILGSQTVLDQETLPIGASATEAIRTMTRPQMVRTVQGKNMPIISGPQAEVLGKQELPPQNEEYPVKQQEQQKETQQQEVTQQVFAPHLQRILRHAVPVHHINVNRFIQPIVNREVQPVLEVQVQEGKQHAPRIATKKANFHEGNEAPAAGASGIAPEVPAATGAELPPAAATGAEMPAEVPAAGASGAAPAIPSAPAAAPSGMRMSMYRTGAVRAALASRLAAAVTASPAANTQFALQY